MGPFPKPERLVTSSISQPDPWGSPSLLWAADALAAGYPDHPPTRCSSLHHSGIRGKAEETEGWQARSRQSLH